MEEQAVNGKKVVIINTQNGSTTRTVLEDVTVNNLQELLNEAHISVNYNRYKVVEQSSGSEVDVANSEIRNNGVYYIVARKATSSGMATNRSEVMAKIKEAISKRPELKSVFNQDKNYTNKSTDVLVDLYTKHVQANKNSATKKEKTVKNNCTCVSHQSNGLEERIARIEAEIKELRTPKLKVAEVTEASDDDIYYANRFRG